ncbi:DUF2316 family protein [Nakamurella leprariae]|uniref:DUF2316 family protein n=1 Tax=Nakamurella leprariae TaxID=2803911 RepID=A0A938YJT2_9ACTN|nr:DUF2316 family protein [Nakamurella leprariae]MBM9469173.1 DUF2316 family protein [Nakamurella leprariae]
MSLNAEERERTGKELQQNLSRVGLEAPQLARRLGWSAARVESTLAVDSDSDPTDVWEVRDFLTDTARQLGADAMPFTALTPMARMRARMWFELRKPPRYTPSI